MPTPLCLVDRSRYETGLQHCERARFLGYHLGPAGTGIRKRATAMPLLTGTKLHEPAAVINQWVLDHDQQLPPRDVVREAIAKAQATYRKTVEKHGFDLSTTPDLGGDQAYMLDEQLALVEALTWLWAEWILPGILETHLLRHVEREAVIVIGCTCGVGEMLGTLAQHEARDCTGIGFMSRPDLITQRRNDGGWGYHEIKSVGAIYQDWLASWAHKIQFLVGAAGMEAQLGVEFVESYVHGLVKGARKSAYDVTTGRYTGPRSQSTCLIYGYKQEGKGILPADYQPRYEWVDEWGKARRLGKTYHRFPVWNEEFAGKPEEAGISSVEYWIRWLGKDVLNASYQRVGPLSRQQWMEQMFFRQVGPYEEKWKETLWQLYECEQSGHGWGTPEYMALLDRLVPCSWECHPFRRECQFIPICFQEAGWQTPTDPVAGLYVPRRPHHAPERVQVQARGITIPDNWAEEEEDVDEA